MTRKLLAVSVVVLATVPAVALGGTSLAPLARQNASAAAASCVRLHGPGHKSKHAYAKCVSAKELAASLVVAAAAQTCQAEQADTGFASSHNGITFAQFYGTNSIAAC